MGNWNDDFQNYFAGNIPTDKCQILEQFAWVETLHQKAVLILDPTRMEEMDPTEIYHEIEELSVPECAIRVTNLGRMNQAADVVESLIRLMKTQGGFDAKYRAAKIPQAGVVTVSELLCLAKPHRFFIRNTAFTKALAKVVPFYSKRGLDELAYNDLLDIVKQLTLVQEKWFADSELGEWAKKLRYLLLYAVLTH